ncbi:unnamed protein product, partial [marine sediment metagenome]
SDISKARLCARFADRRVVEIIYMANKGDVQQVEAITQRLDNRLVMLARLTSAVQVAEAPLPTFTPSEEAGSDKDVRVRANNRANLRTTLASYALSHPAGLRAALEKAPKSAKPALQRAIDISTAGYKRALKALD